MYECPATTANEYERRQIAPLSPLLPLPEKPLLQVVVEHEHTPAEHVDEVAHALPQRPQFEALVERFTQLEPQSV